MDAPTPRLTDSLWFWIYLFGAAALIAMFLLGQKADDVQAQRDANYARRQASLERQAAGGAGEVTPSVLADKEHEEPRFVDFKVFYAIIGSLTVIAWIMHWRQYLHHRRAAQPGPTP